MRPNVIIRVLIAHGDPLISAGLAATLSRLRDFETAAGGGRQPAADVVIADYESIRAQIRKGGVDSVTGDLGKLVQARTKGRGHGSTSRAFYARSIFVAHILNLQKLASMPLVFPDVDFHKTRLLT